MAKKSYNETASRIKELGYQISEDGLTEWRNNGGVIERRFLYADTDWELCSTGPATKEELINMCREGNYKYLSTEYGTIDFEGETYFLTDHAQPSSRLLPGGYTNFHEAEDGELYDFEMTANAIDAQGLEYMVSWIFEDEKGENGRELDSYDYDTPDNVREI